MAASAGFSPLARFRLQFDLGAVVLRAVGAHTASVMFTRSTERPTRGYRGTHDLGACLRRPAAPWDSLAVNLLGRRGGADTDHRRFPVAMTRAIETLPTVARVARFPTWSTIACGRGARRATSSWHPRPSRLDTPRTLRGEHVSSLWVAQEAVDNVFALNGHKEDDFSLAIAWSLASCPEFLSRFLADYLSWHGPTTSIDIHVHRHMRDTGTTDIEIRLPDHFHIIVEAKLGPVLPGASQLNKYAKRLLDGAEPIKLILTLSECPAQYAERYSTKNISSVGVKHVTWHHLTTLAQESISGSRNADKRTLRDLERFMRRYHTMQDITSNMVFVVSLRTDKEAGWQIRWIDIEAKHHRYFHPLAPNWPRQPPNYIAFRYGGRLQAIHHVERSEIIHDLSEACPGIPSSPVEPHYLYHLGPAIHPAHEVRTGKLYASSRVWCHIDTLLTAPTVYEALQITKRRQKFAGDS